MAPSSSTPAKMSIKSKTQREHIIILGADITGLSTSLALSQKGYTQTIIASHLPGDESIDYTSPWAGGHWRFFASLSDDDAEVRKWDKRTYEAWMAMLENGYLNQEEMDERGIGERESRNYWAKATPETAGLDNPGLWWSAPRFRDMTVPGPKSFQGGVKGFEVLDLEKEREETIPPGTIFGVKYRTVCLNIPQHLSFNFQAVKAQNTRVIIADVNVSHGLEGVVKDAKRILMTQDPSVKEEDVLAVINCTGLGARHFVSAQEAAKLYPIRGQTILVKGEAKMARTFIGFGDESELVYVIPRPGSGTTIIGGYKEVGNWNGEVDAALNEKILERVTKWGLVEELRTGKHGQGGLKVLSYQVGLRPGRKGGPRVEVEGEDVGEGAGKVDGVWVLHCYGRAGGGYQCSLGCSERVLQIVEGLE